MTTSETVDSGSNRDGDYWSTIFFSPIYLQPTFITFTITTIIAMHNRNRIVLDCEQGTVGGYILLLLPTNGLLNP